MTMQKGNFTDGLKATADEGFEMLKEKTGAGIDSLTQKANDSFNDLKHTDAYHTIEKSAEQAVKYAKDNVWQTAMVSLGVGFLLGVIFRGTK